MKTIFCGIATFFGVGKIPGAPGTWGSLAGACGFYFLMAKPPVYWSVLGVLFFLGVWAATRVENMIGHRDPSCVVIDEVCGVGIAMLGIPQQWPYIIMAIILFRIFDVWKPFPIRKTEKLPGGWGIMCDDLLAGLYANIWVHMGAFVVQMIQ